MRRVFAHVEQLADHPESGSRPKELGKSRYRQLVEPPCRVFYRFDGIQVLILHVMRTERLLRKGTLAARNKLGKKWFWAITGSGHPEPVIDACGALPHARSIAVDTGQASWVANADQKPRTLDAISLK